MASDRTCGYRTAEADRICGERSAGAVSPRLMKSRRCEAPTAEARPQIQVLLLNRSISEAGDIRDFEHALEEEVNDILAPQGMEDNIEASVPKNDVAVQQLDQIVPVVASRSGRIIKRSLRFELLGESYDRIHEELNDEALQDTNAKNWVVSMKSEIESMYSNQVRDLIEPPTGVKPIDGRWIYKKKRGVDEKV
ncbi:PREDICTED: uncharacterized protein LOC109212494 [Nicotiana attenuata]|uniref:uncharacterized protein LOC109212494 n=1 Tax=Nicotiana attenuata TaxID=49451 RepID=UPI0009053A32|nr:PREDICTED: uncharacterized protein LOC109212494 [Nicotiana attenuata]